MGDRDNGRLKLYFDTCALHALALVQPWAEGWSPKLSPRALGPALFEDYQALYDMFRIFQTSPQEIVFSELSIDEAWGLPKRHPEARDTYDYVMELVDWVQAEFGARPIGIKGNERAVNEVIASHDLHLLPQQQDRVHLGLAILAGCDYFITVDYKTILRHRRQLISIPLRIVRPLEYCQGHELPEP